MSTRWVTQEATSRVRGGSFGILFLNRRSELAFRRTKRSGDTGAEVGDEAHFECPEKRVSRARLALGAEIRPNIDQVWRTLAKLRPFFQT